MMDIKNMSDAQLDERYAAIHGGEGEEGKSKAWLLARQILLDRLRHGVDGRRLRHFPNLFVHRN